MINSQQKKIIMLTIGTGLAYYFLVFLPEQEREQQQLLQAEMQQRELERKQAELNAQVREQQQEQERLRKLENIKKKKLHWRRNRTVKS